MRNLVYFFLSLAFFTGCEKTDYKNLEDGIYADIETDKGNIIVELYAEKVPLTVANFISLAEGINPNVSDSFKGKKFYDSLTFHRVLKDFMIQGGDPLANGQGGPGYKFRDEFSPDTKENQLKDCGNPRVGCHSVFGKVVSNLDLLDSINQKDIIRKLTIIRKGVNAKEFDAVKVFEEELAKDEEKEKERLIEMEKLENERLDRFLKNQEVFHEKMGIKKAKKQASGLQILTFKKGRGKKFNSAISSTIHYSMYLADGKMIQSTEGSDPFVFILDEKPLIQGVKEAITNMRVGGKVRLFIPYYLGYGEAGGDPFPKKADLIFDLELIKVGN